MVPVHAVSHSSTAIFSLKLIWVQNCSTKTLGSTCLKTKLNAGCTVIPWHLFQFWFIVLFNKFCTKYQGLSVSSTFVFLVHYIPPSYSVLWLFFWLISVIFSIVEVAEFFIIISLLFMFLFVFHFAYILIEKGIQSSRCGRWSCISVVFLVFMHCFVGILTFHTYIFFCCSADRCLYWTVQNNPKSFFTWLSKLSFNPRKSVWWMSPPNVHCVALLYSLYLV